MTHLVQHLRRQELYKVPGVSEDDRLGHRAGRARWPGARRRRSERDAGPVLKTKEDLESVRGEKLASLVALCPTFSET
jgi:hypothetical protein